MLASIHRRSRTSSHTEANNSSAAAAIANVQIGAGTPDPVGAVTGRTGTVACGIDGAATACGAGAGAIVETRAPGDEIAVWQSNDVLKIDVQSGLKDLRVELSPPAGETLHPGTYTGARFRGQADPALPTPGIFVYTGGNVCSEAYADFTIDRLDETGTDLTFVQHCGSPDGPATRGEVHFHA